MARVRRQPPPAAPALTVGDRVVSTVATAVLPAGRAGTVVAVGDPATWGRNVTARVHLIAFDAGTAGSPGGRWHYARSELRVVADG